MKWDGDGTSRWLILTCQGTFADLAKQKLELKEGLEVTFYADDADEHGTPDDLEADGVCHFDSKAQYWIGRINWNAIRHASDLRLLYEHIVTKSPQGVQYSEAVKLMLLFILYTQPSSAGDAKAEIDEGSVGTGIFMACRQWKDTFRRKNTQYPF